MSIFKRLRFAFHLRKDAILPVSTTLLSSAGGIFSYYHPSRLLLASFVALSAFTMLWAMIPVFRSINSPYTAFFNKPSQAIAWLRERMGGSQCRLLRMGVDKVTVLGASPARTSATCSPRS